MRTPIEKRMLSVDELGHYIGLAAKSIRNKRSNGTFPIPAKKIGRRVLFDIKDVNKYLDK